MKVDTEIETVVTKRYSASLGREAVLSLLQALDPPPTDGARIYVQVPGGGDWSNEDLDIGRDADLEVRWEETEES